MISGHRLILSGDLQSSSGYQLGYYMTPHIVSDIVSEMPHFGEGTMSPILIMTYFQHLHLGVNECQQAELLFSDMLMVS
jgi:acyl-CoA reductase-like NAD-dependent aldehyde dehydrogenase